MRDKKIISIIPARGGSKGIPNKNLKLLVGKSLIVHTIEHSLNSKLVSETYVSTDSKKIKEISLKAGAKVIDRPNKLASDTASSESAILHGIKHLQKKKINPEYLVFLQCTSPLRRANDIDFAIKKLMNNNLDSLFSGFENNYFIWRQATRKVTPINYDPLNRPRRQEREKEYVENGSIYIFKTEKFLEVKNRICGTVGVYEMPYRYSFEIDEPFDFWLCEQIYEKLMD